MKTGYHVFLGMIIKRLHNITFISMLCFVVLGDRFFKIKARDPPHHLKIWLTPDKLACPFPTILSQKTLLQFPCSFW